MSRLICGMLTLALAVAPLAAPAVALPDNGSVLLAQQTTSETSDDLRAMSQKEFAAMKQELTAMRQEMAAMHQEMVAMKTEMMKMNAARNPNRKR